MSDKDSKEVVLNPYSRERLIKHGFIYIPPEDAEPLSHRSSYIWDKKEWDKLP